MWFCSFYFFDLLQVHGNKFEKTIKPNLSTDLPWELEAVFIIFSFNLVVTLGSLFIYDVHKKGARTVTKFCAILQMVIGGIFLIFWTFTST